MDCRWEVLVIGVLVDEALPGYAGAPRVGSEAGVNAEMGKRIQQLKYHM
jgi:hypothetical protein